MPKLCARLKNFDELVLLCKESALGNRAMHRFRHIMLITLANIES